MKKPNIMHYFSTWIALVFLGILTFHEMDTNSALKSGITVVCMFVLSACSTICDTITFYSEKGIDKQ